MKKSVIFLISIIYVISIVVVTFFGMQITIDQFQVYMTKVEITNYDQIIGNEKYKSIKFDDTEGNVSFFVEYETYPDNATHPEKVSFTIAGNTHTDKDGNLVVDAEVLPNGEVVFYGKTMVRVTINTTDGSSCSDSINIICR